MNFLINQFKKKDEKKRKRKYAIGRYECCIFFGSPTYKTVKLENSDDVAGREPCRVNQNFHLRLKLYLHTLVYDNAEE